METESVAYKCPSCGGSLVFDAFTGNFTCHYCGSAFTKDDLDRRFTLDELTLQESFEWGIKEENVPVDEAWNRSNNLYNCPSCGAGIITDTLNDVSVRCHYCNSPVVLAGRLAGEFRPDKIIPFSKTRDYAEQEFKKWSGKFFFVPKDFRSARTLAEMKGVYVPFWLADCCVEGEMEALCTNSTSVRHGDTVTTTHKEYLARRNGSVICRGVPADGSSKAADLLMENIEPFDYTAMKPFDMSYLSGHSAEKYDIGKEQMLPRIQQRVNEEAEGMFRNSIKGYSTVKVTKKSFNITGINWTYAMFPVWFLSYHYKGELYCFAMNGQTGKFSGRLPFNKLKFAIFAILLFLGMAAVAGGLIWLGSL